MTHPGNRTGGPQALAVSMLALAVTHLRADMVGTYRQRRHAWRNRESARLWILGLTDGPLGIDVVAEAAGYSAQLVRERLAAELAPVPQPERPAA